MAIAWVAIVRPGPLDLPFWWDEADVYVPGAWWVAHHDLVITPGVFPDDWSRGHPPGLYWLAGIAFAAFGGTPTVAHLVVLPFTVTTLAFTYLLGARLFGRAAGAGAALLLGTTPLFMAIGNVLLPEVPLTCLAVAAFLALTYERIALAALLGVLAVALKETGIFAAGAIGLALLGRALVARRAGRSVPWRELAWSCLPLVTLVVFFAWQKANAGYFVFPHHANLFAERRYDPATALPSIFVWHGRWIVVVAAGLALLAGRRFGAHPTRSVVVMAFAWLVLINAAFFGQMFWLERYALPAHPGVLVLLAGVLMGDIARTNTLGALLRGAPVAAAIVVGALHLHAPTEPDAEEQTFAYADAIATHRAAFAPILAAEDPLVLASWPMQVELRDPRLGFVPRAVRTEHPRDAASERHDFVLFGARSWRAEELRRRARQEGLTRVETYRVGVASPLELWSR